MATPTLAKRYTLTGGENTYSSPASVNEADARKLQSLIPSLSGALERERPAIPFTADAPFPSRVGFFHQFKRNNSGVIVTYLFCATATELYQLVAGAWSPVLALQAFPVAVNINNTMHISDGTSSFIFDGISFVKGGLEIPLHAPTFSVQNGGAAVAITAITRVNGLVTVSGVGIAPTFTGAKMTLAGVSDATFDVTATLLPGGTSGSVQFSQPGFPDSASSGGTIQQSVFSVLANRYYWTTFSDQSTTHPHESSASPTSLGTGPITGKIVQVFQRAGSVAGNGGNTAIVGTGTDFSQSDVGLKIYTNGNPLGNIIASVQDPQHLTLATPLAGNSIGFPAIIVPSRATHWNVYASSSEEDKLGSLLATVPVSPTTNLFDQSPMIGTVGAYFQNVQRPLLNDPPLPTVIMEVHKNRIWRRVPKFPNFFSYTGFEEVLAEQAGTPSETVPGDDPNTVSPGQINETSYPDQSSTITGIRKHGDALFIGTEINVIPLYGSSLADFQLSEAQAFAVGFAGRRLSCSTPFGLAFLSYDLKVYLYPSQYSFGVDSTTALVELGRPKRPEFETIDGTDFDNGHMVFYNWGRRNWLVLSYRRTDQTFATWVFDFEVKGWFQLQQGYTAVAVFETSLGKKSLLGAGTDNRVYVIDDLTGNFPVPGASNYPVGYFRVLLDFNDPDSNFLIRNIEFEKSNRNMEVDVTVWLDPNDPENPGTGIPIIMSRKKLGSNVYSGRPSSETGSACQRVLVEFAAASGNQNGTFRGFAVEADKIVSPVL